MYTEVVTETKHFEVLREEWNTLLERSHQKSIFLTWEWLYYSWIHFKNGNQLFILLIRNKEKGELIGIAPFCIQKINLFQIAPLKMLKFLGTEKVASDFLDFIIYPGEEHSTLMAIFEYLYKNQPIWDAIELGEIDKDSNSLGWIKRNVIKKYQLAEQRAHICPYIKLPESYELLQKSLSTNMRNNLKRRTKQIEAKREVKFFITKQKEEVKENIDSLFDLHNKRFEDKYKAKKMQSSFNGVQIKKFHYDVANEFLLNDYLRLYSLELENRAIALLYAFKYKDRLYYYQSGIDPAWGNFGLGTVLFGYCMNNSIDQGLREFNFLRGNEEYKYRWTKAYKETVNIYITPMTPTGIILYSYIRIKGIMKRILKRNRYGQRNHSDL